MQCLFFALVGPHDDDGADCDYPRADPDPHDEGVDVQVKEGDFFAVSHVNALVERVEVFAQVGPNGDFCGALLILSLVIDFLVGPHGAQSLPVFIDAELGDDVRGEWVDGFGNAFIRERVGSDVGGFHVFEFDLGIFVERIAGKSDEEQDHAKVDDITAVSAAISSGEVDECAEIGFARTAAARTRSAVKFGDDGACDKAAEEEGDDGVDVAYAEGDGDDAADQPHDARSREVFSQAFARGAPPGEQRTYAREYEQEQANGYHDGVEVGGTYGDFVTGNGFGDYGKHDAPEDGECGGEEEQVVEQKTTFAGDGGFVLGFGFEQVQARDEEEA